MPVNGDGHELFRGLWPLPGGQGRYLATLLEILQWIHQHPIAQDAELYSWMQARYGLNPRTPKNYTDVADHMGLLTIARDHRVTLTGQGQEFVRAGETERVQLVLHALMRRFRGTYQVLDTVARSGVGDGKSLLGGMLVPSWTSPHQYDYRLGWLHSLGCLEKVAGGYVITQLGRRTLEEYASNHAGLENIEMRQSSPHESLEVATDEDAAELEQRPAASPAEVKHEQEPFALQVVRDETDLLADRIRAAGLESDDAVAFERAIADAFTFLGFKAEHRSGPGDTDVLVTAPMGQETFSAVVDGKSSRHGKVGNRQIDWLALGKHKEQHHARHILVVAPSFSGGDLLDNAAKVDAGLISAEDLAAVVRLHASTPLSLADLTELFRYPGQPERPLQRIQEKAAEVARLQQLLPDIIRTFERSYASGVFDPVSADALHHILAHDYGRVVYARDEITAGLEILCAPLVGALRRVTEATYALQMPIASVGRRFQAQARQLLDARDRPVDSGAGQLRRW